jgi:hypothetical protein
MRDPAGRWQCRGVRLLVIGWIVTTPYGFAAAASASERVRTMMARHYVPMVTAGWAGVAGLAFAAFAMHGMARAAVLALCAPLCGLSFWARTDGGGGGGGDDGGPDPDDGPGDDDVDWDRFMSDLDRYAARRREPVAR